MNMPIRAFQPHLSTVVMDDFSSCSRPVSAAEVGYAESKVSTRALSRRLSLMLLDLF